LITNGLGGSTPEPFSFLLLQLWQRAAGEIRYARIDTTLKKEQNPPQ